MPLPLETGGLSGIGLSKQGRERAQE
jgi:hypothetical protein